jgi:hypothetical protein
MAIAVAAPLVSTVMMPVVMAFYTAMVMIRDGGVEQNNACQTIERPEIIMVTMGLRRCRGNAGGNKKGTQNQHFGFHGKPPMFKLQLKLMKEWLNGR